MVGRGLHPTLNKDVVRSKLMVQQFDWDEAATDAFTQFELDRKIGLEKDDSMEDVRSIDELQ